MFGTREQFIDGRFFDYSACVHDSNSICNFGDHAQIVSYQ
jgi:hypothetical protein